MPYWIKKRVNPQEDDFHVPCGEMEVKDAMEEFKMSVYGSTLMLRFETKDDYDSQVKEICSLGPR